MSIHKKFITFIQNTAEPYIEHVIELERMNHEFEESELKKLNKIKDALETYENLDLEQLRSQEVNPDSLEKEISKYQDIRKDIAELIEELAEEHEGKESLEHLRKVHDELEELEEILEEID